jgi:hypothetical protein
MPTTVITFWKRSRIFNREVVRRSSYQKVNYIRKPAQNFFALVQSRASKKAPKVPKAQKQPRITPKDPFCYIFEK